MMEFAKVYFMESEDADPTFVVLCEDCLDRALENATTDDRVIVDGEEELLLSVQFHYRDKYDTTYCEVCGVEEEE